MKYTYLLINIISVILPIVFSFHPKLPFRKEWKMAIFSIFFTALFFILWDIWFTYKNIWMFNESYILGKRMLGLPFEEYLFFLTIPYASLFLYSYFRLKVQNLEINNLFGKTVSLLLVSGLVVFALVYHDRQYTFVSFTICAMVLLFCYVKWNEFLNKFLLYFIFLLIPFFLVDGILTGSFIGRMVVIYNASEISGVRILTIPIEDFAFGMALMVVNTLLYERIQTSGIKFFFNHRQ